MFHPYSFYLQKHKNAKIKRESALPFFSFPLLLHLVIHTPDAPNRLLLCPILPFGVSHFTIWDVPFRHLGCPISPFGVYFRHICAQCTARFSVCLLRFSLQNMCVFFVNWENWFSTFLHFCNFDDVPSSKELTLGLPQINLGILSLNRFFVILCFCVFVFLCFCVFAFYKCETASVQQLKQVSLRSLTRSFVNLDQTWQKIQAK